MPADYIPSTDTGFKDWALNFNTLITATPTAYGLTAGQATAYATAYSLYEAALFLVVNPGTRTPPAIADKNTEKAALLALSRSYAAIVQAFPTITDMQLTDLGLTVRDTSRTPVPTPTAIPELAVQSLLPLQVKLRLKEIGTLLSPFPVGAPECEIWYKTGDVAPVDLTGCVFAGLATRRFFMHDIDAADGGKRIHYIARYKTLTNKMGPLSSTLSTTVPH